MTLINHILYWVLWHVLKGEEREKKKKEKCNYQNNNLSPE